MSYRDDGEALLERIAALEAENRQLRIHIAELEDRIRKPPDCELVDTASAQVSATHRLAGTTRSDRAATAQ